GNAAFAAATAREASSRVESGTSSTTSSVAGLMTDRGRPWLVRERPSIQRDFMQILYHSRQNGEAETEFSLGAVSRGRPFLLLYDLGSGVALGSRPFFCVGTFLVLAGAPKDEGARRAPA